VPEGYEKVGGAEGIRTPDPKTASLVLSQLSYSPTRNVTLQVPSRRCQGMVPVGGVGTVPACCPGHPSRAAADVMAAGRNGSSEDR
jgi:hypothetical protein